MLVRTLAALVLGIVAAQTPPAAAVARVAHLVALAGGAGARSGADRALSLARSKMYSDWVFLGTAILGRDDRAGAMAMLFATERMED